MNLFHVYQSLEKSSDTAGLFATYTSEAAAQNAIASMRGSPHYDATSKAARYYLVKLEATELSPKEKPEEKAKALSEPTEAAPVAESPPAPKAHAKRAHF